MKHLKIAILEENTLIRQGIKSIIEEGIGTSEFIEYRIEDEIFMALEINKIPDIIIADIYNGKENGFYLLKHLKQNYPTIKFIILTNQFQANYITQTFIEGTKAYLLKTIHNDELIFSIKQVARGKQYLCVDLLEKLLVRLNQNFTQIANNSFERVNYTERELEVIELLLEGLTNQQIADKLFLSKRTVEGHRKSLIHKTGSKNTAGLIKFALLNGILN